MALIQFFRDEILIDDQINNILNDDQINNILNHKVTPGDTVVFGAKLIEIKMGKNVDLLPGCNIILIADVLLSGNVSVTPIDINPSPSVTIVARQIINPKKHKPRTPTGNYVIIDDIFDIDIKFKSPKPLRVKSRGLDGKDGTPGVHGGWSIMTGTGTSGVLIQEPATPGGDGQNGFPGGDVVVCYVEANTQPVLHSIGGKGGC